MPDAIRTITADELKLKLDRGDDFRLVNALGAWEFRAAHIPGSEHFENLNQTMESLMPDEEIVVYCTNPACRASHELYNELVEHGYGNVRRFEGGLEAWAGADYPLDGDGIT